MLNKREFADIRAELARSENEREVQIQGSREIIRLSKLIIYALHREDPKKAEALAKKIKSKIKKLSSKGLTGIMNVAFQEYTEALALLSFVKSGKIPTRKGLGVGTENYLGGISDLTGELVRMAVNLAIKKKHGKVMAIKDVVGAVYGEFLQLNLRGGELRKKSDQIKWNLQKLEDMAYNISKNG